MAGGSFYADIDFSKLTQAEIDKFPVGISMYTAKFTDVDRSSSPITIAQVRFKLFIAQDADIIYHSVSYTNQGDTTLHQIDFANTDSIAEFCGNNAAKTLDANVSYQWDSANDQQTVFFDYDENFLEYEGVWYNFNGDNPAWSDDWDTGYTSAGIPLNFNMDANTMGKEIEFGFKDLNDMEVSLYFKCSF